MNRKIQIRNHDLPKSPRVFDVTVNEAGEILRYDMQNIKGCVFIEDEAVRKQIREALEREVG